MPRSIPQIYHEMGRIIDLMPDNGSIQTSYINTDDGRPLVPAKAYLRELQLDLDRYIPRRTADGRFERRKPR